MKLTLLALNPPWYGCGNRKDTPLGVETLYFIISAFFFYLKSRYILLVRGKQKEIWILHQTFIILLVDLQKFIGRHNYIIAIIHCIVFRVQNLQTSEPLVGLVLVIKSVLFLMLVDAFYSLNLIIACL